ncbi:GNAT family N-acetyltransferase [Bauldia sp.]|uniref:GNAT family N-acetyltransferase n=1 Tax=Bauldia sp. TaxID=2575872 RepID=UPI003BAC79C5
MPLMFRQMDVSDLPSVFAVRQSTVENAITMDQLRDDYGITPESLARAMESDVRGWLCEEDGKVVGFSMGDRSNGEVQVVAVLPTHEGRGVGSTLLSQVRDWLASEGYEEIWLLANPDPNIRATGFYKKLGWRATGVMRGHDEVFRLRLR